MLLTTLPPLPPNSNSIQNPLSHPSFLLLDHISDSRQLPQTLPPLFKQGLHHHPFVQTKLLSLFSRFSKFPEAHLISQSILEKTDEIHHTLLKAHARNSPLDAALSYYSTMRLSGISPVIFNFIYLLKSCSDSVDIRRGREVLAQVFIHRFGFENYVMTAVMNMFAKCGLVKDARKVFDRMPERDLVAWNAAVSAYSKNGMAREALEMVAGLLEDGKRPDSVTVVSVLPACASVGCLRTGMAVHGFAIWAGFDCLVNVASALVDMYSKCGDVEMARRVFDGMSVRNAVAWNALIDGYGQNGDPERALEVFKKMMGEGIQVTDVTVMCVLYACGELGNVEEGKRVHEFLVRIGLDSDVSVMNALITMYSKCKRVDLAAEVFENLMGKTLVSWNAMIWGYAQNDRPTDALRLFCKMQLEDVKPDSFTLVSVIPALADVSVLRQAKWIHGFAIRSCFDKNLFVRTALIDLYAKCGAISMARRLFDGMNERHVTTWNAMIDGYGSHGFGRAAIKLFEEMQRCPVKPNDVTFLSVISSCSHAGLVEEGKRYFSSMKQEYGIEPGMDHYGSMVDLLGRAGRLDEAWNFIQDMPVKPSISVYGAMLGACKIHKNIQLGQEAAKRIFELQPVDGGYHVLLANIYKSASMWNDVARVRTMMEKQGLQKTPGYSTFDLKNEIHTFYSGSTNHPRAEKIYERLTRLLDEIKAVGYVPRSESLHDVEEDISEQLLNMHSEKLAISFALISTAPGTTIQIRKNLRVCTDCHSATKFISQVTGREIIVRDMQRFHHFKNGQCSCGDYW